MILKLNKISLLPLAYSMSVLYAITGLMIGFVVAIGSQSTPEGEGLAELGFWAIVILPLINAILGFACGAFMAFCYNHISKWFGALEFDFEQVDSVTLKGPLS